MRHQRGEWVVRHFRSRFAHRADERALAHVWEAKQTDVGHDLELEAQVPHLAGFARLGVARRAVFGSREVFVAAATLATFGDHEPLLRPRELAQLLLRVAVEHDGADRDAHLDVFRRTAVTVFALPVATRVGAYGVVMNQIVECAEARICDQHDVPTAPTVAAGGAAEGDVFLAPKRDRTFAAATCFDPKLTLVDKPHRSRLDLALIGANLGKIAPRFRSFSSEIAKTLVRLAAWALGKRLEVRNAPEWRSSTRWLERQIRSGRRRLPLRGRGRALVEEIDRGQHRFNPVVARGRLQEDIGYASKLERGGLAQIELPFGERLEGREALGSYSFCSWMCLSS